MFQLVPAFSDSIGPVLYRNEVFLQMGSAELVASSVGLAVAAVADVDLRK